MDKFLKEVAEYKDHYLAIKFSRVELNKIKELALVKLNLQNINQLRDKYEGVAFFERFSSTILGKMALEKVLGLKLIGKRIDGDITYKINDKDFIIITSKYGEFPLIKKPESRNIIFNIRQNETTFWICGIATPEILNNFSDDKISGNLLNSTNAQFFGFNKLKFFKDLDTFNSATDE